MNINIAIGKLRREAGLSQEGFANLFNVSQQSVQKWESGESLPEINKLVAVAKHFGVSLDALILGNDNRIVEEMRNSNQIKPQYNNIHDWEFYSSNLCTEYQQSVEEGLDIERYKDIFLSISHLPKNETKKKLGDILFETVQSAPKIEGYEFEEPSSLELIKELRAPYEYSKNKIVNLESKISGAWFGRICGCLLGKPIEGIRSDELIPFLKETDNYPMKRYVQRSDLTEEVLSKYKFSFSSRRYADEIDSMPFDDDTNYTVLYQQIIEKYGRDFTPFDVSRAWLDYQPKNAYCTAERVAFCNFVKGYEPPYSAIYKNPYREWIGAQIRGDYFGYINPGNPELAAEMAWRDASISHTKNGIYGEMFVAAMIAVAAETTNLQDIILGGLAQIPKTSRLYKEIKTVLSMYNENKPEEECLKYIQEHYNEYTSHGWCHTISNAMIVVTALLYGKGDYGKSICMAVQSAYDTDCNGATVGSILGMANGIESIPEYWTKPINNTLNTTIFGIHKVKITDRVALTLKHISSKN